MRPKFTGREFRRAVHMRPFGFRFGIGSVNRVVSWMNKNDAITESSSVLDLGCGNGLTLIRLVRAEYHFLKKPDNSRCKRKRATLKSWQHTTFSFQNENGFRDLTGVDYIQNAVDLAEAVAKEHNAQIIYQVQTTFMRGHHFGLQWEKDWCLEIQTSPPPPRCGHFHMACTWLQQGNILEPVMTSSCLQRQYDVCHDKGTYDAICLHPDNPLEKRAQYQTNVRKLLKDNGWFIITSCNWTKDELRAHFEPRESLLRTTFFLQLFFGLCDSGQLSLMDQTSFIHHGGFLHFVTFHAIWRNFCLENLWDALCPCRGFRVRRSHSSSDVPVWGSNRESWNVPGFPEKRHPLLTPSNCSWFLHTVMPCDKAQFSLWNLNLKPSSIQQEQRMWCCVSAWIAQQTLPSNLCACQSASLLRMSHELLKIRFIFEYRLQWWQVSEKVSQSCLFWYLSD